MHGRQIGSKHHPGDSVSVDTRAIFISMLYDSRSSTYRGFTVHIPVIVDSNRFMVLDVQVIVDSICSVVPSVAVIAVSNHSEARFDGCVHTLRVSIRPLWSC